MSQLQTRAKPRQSCGPDQSESEQAAYFGAALERALVAESKTEIVERFFAVANCVLSLRFAEDSLARSFTPALAHLEVSPVSSPDAVFHIWDSESTGTDMLPPPCSRGCFTSRGDIWTMASPRYKSAYLWSEYALNLFDNVTATGMYWTPAATTLPYWATASPLRCLFHWWAESKGCQLVHAAAVGHEDGALLITGKGGLGKSTTALACLGNGLAYIGDDYVLVQLDPVPTVHSLYCTAKLNQDQMARFPGLADLATRCGSEDDKAVMYLYPRMKGQITRSLPLQAIATPRIGNRPQTALGTISRAAMRHATGFTTMSQLPHAGQSTYQFVDRLVASLPAFELALGSDLDAIPAVIVELLSNPASETISSSNVTSATFISVIVPVQSGARFLRQAVASVLAQNYPAIEIIVVHDGSRASIEDDLCLPAMDVRFFKHHDTRRAAALNRGIREASGRLITFLDADNLWPEGALQTLAEPLLSDESCDVVQAFGPRKVATETAGADSAEAMPDCITAAIFRREAFQKVGLFDQELGSGEDGRWYYRARQFGLKIRQIQGVALIQHHASDAGHGAIQQEVTALRALKNALDRARARGIAD